MARTARPGTREALVDAARAEFARRGLDLARVEDIARRAGISKGAFYLHFRTKDEALQEIVQRFLGALEEHARRRHEAAERFARESGGADPARLVAFECALDEELLDVLWRNRAVLAAIDGAGKGYGRVVTDFRRRMRALVEGRIEDRHRAGQLRRDVDPAIVRDVVVGAYEAFARRMIDLNEKPDLAAWARSLLVALYDGILEHRPTRGRASHR